MNALQRLIHKINWPEIHWSCRQSVSPFVCVSLLSLCVAFLCKHTHTNCHKHTPSKHARQLMPSCSSVLFRVAVRSG